MPQSRIFYTKPSISPLEIQFASDAAANGWGERCYAYIDRFESEFCAHLGVNHAVATSSCTGAMHMGLSALGIGQGDEVLIGDINWIASVAPILYLSAKPVLIDVCRDTWCIDPEKVEAAITAKTKAIIAVHIYGNMCNMDRLRDIGDRYNIPVVEDAAEAIGSEWNGCRAGSMGEFGTFSFHGTKTITTGEGGMFVTNNASLHEKVLTLSNHGRSRNQTKQFWPDVIGYKYKLSNIQAAIGCAQLERIDELISKKRFIFSCYAELFKGYPVQLNPEPPGTRNGYWMPTIIVDDNVSFNRENLLNDLKANGIDGRVFFWPLSLLPMFKDNRNNFISYSLYQRGLNLPSYHDLTKSDIERVAQVVCANLEKQCVSSSGGFK